MNENQHDAYVVVCRARTEFAFVRRDMAKARRELRAALDVLHTAIRRDPDSWSGTPKIEKTDDEIADTRKEVKKR